MLCQYTPIFCTISYDLQLFSKASPFFRIKSVSASSMLPILTMLMLLDEIQAELVANR